MSFIKWFDSSLPNAPSLSAAPGTLISILDACLVDGFYVSPIIRLTQENGIATAVLAGGHQYKTHAVVAISGATQAAYNGEFQVIGYSHNSFSFAINAQAPAQATGQLQCRIAPLGWNKAFVNSSEQKAAYKANDPEANGHYLFIDDAFDRYAEVSGFEHLHEIDNGDGQFKAEANYWPRSNVTSQNATRDWVLVGDSQFFWFFPKWHDSYEHDILGFGDAISFLENDGYNTLLISCGQTDYPGRGSMANFLGYIDEYRSVVSARSHSQLPGAVAITPYSHGLGAYWEHIYSSYFAGSSSTSSAVLSVQVPNPVDASVLAFEVYQYARGEQALRGRFPGLYVAGHRGDQMHFATGADLDQAINQPDVNLKAIAINQSFRLKGSSSERYSRNLRRQLFIDLNPWR